MGDSSVILCEGYLTKTGPLNKPVLTWTRRWFVLEQIRTEGPSRPRFQLTYYASNEKSNQKGVIPIHQFLYINTDVKKRGRRNLFSIVTRPRTYIVSAESEGQMEMWLAKLSEALGCERVYHVTPLMGDKWGRRRDALVRFRDDSIELICPNQIGVLAKWQLSHVRAMGSSGPMFWIDACPSCSAENETPSGLTFLAVERGLDTCAEMLRAARAAAQRCATDPIVEKAVDFNCTLKLTSHMNCADEQSGGAGGEMTGTQSAVAVTPAKLIRGYSASAAFRPTSPHHENRFSPPFPENKHAAMMARFRSRSVITSSSSSLSSSNHSAAAPLVRVQYDHTTTALGSPTRLHSVHRERLTRSSQNSRYSNSSSRSRLSEDSGLGYSGENIVHDDAGGGGAGPTRASAAYVAGGSFPEESELNDDETNNYGYEVMGPVNEESLSRTSSDSTTSSARNSYCPPLPFGNGYVNFEVMGER